MNNNPFVSDTYTKIWSKHFNDSKSGLTFKFINNISFIKRSSFPIYQNLGKNLTSGITYKITKNNTTDYKGKVFLIRDIPTYYHTNDNLEKGSLKLKKILQYEGFITEVEKYEDLDQYMRSIFKSNSRYKFKRNIERLEACFDIEYMMYRGELSKQEFDNVFEEFYKLLDKRYTNKKERCGELDLDLWAYYCDLCYQMILEKTASLFVIYDNKKPIGITFNYHFDDTFIEALTVFDIDYYSFNIGHTTIFKLLEWSFNNHVKIFDYTHGDFDYKRRWSNNTYLKHHHLLYDASSLKSRFIASFIEMKFNLKRKLRDENFIKKYHNFKHKISNLKNKKNVEYIRYNVSEVVKDVSKRENLMLINIHDELYMSQRKAIFDFLYKKPEPFNKIQVFKNKNENEVYYAFGGINTLLIKLNN